MNTPTPTRRVTPTPTGRTTVTPSLRVTLTPTIRTATPTSTRRGTVTATPTPSSMATPTPTARGTGNYVVAYVIASDWGSGGTVNVTITIKPKIYRAAQGAYGPIESTVLHRNRGLALSKSPAP
ncbi:MAG TPA: hypothetical protein VHY08_11765 [Bacillota bacterium]|nr:hypothetical protein [Bacillota bacterium]